MLQYMCVGPTLICLHTVLCIIDVVQGCVSNHVCVCVCVCVCVSACLRALYNCALILNYAVSIMISDRNFVIKSQCSSCLLFVLHCRNDVMFIL